jgi:hypothetical protein
MAKYWLTLKVYFFVSKYWQHPLLHPGQISIHFNYDTTYVIFCRLLKWIYIQNWTDSDKKTFFSVFSFICNCNTKTHITLHDNTW